uniref:Uncharacterized protein n=1 Tax=Globodera rostochiensis TaxID=31243 RepID=A0A914I1J1_GLORO
MASPNLAQFTYTYYLAVNFSPRQARSKDTTQCGQLQEDRSLNNTVPIVYFDEWSFLCWSLLSVVNRLENDCDTTNKLDYAGKHFKEKIHAALVELVNKAHRMQTRYPGSWTSGYRCPG